MTKNHKPEVTLIDTKQCFSLKSSGNVKTVINGNKIIITNLETGEVIERDLNSNIINANKVEFKV
jgi:hypothetical protein